MNSQTTEYALRAMVCLALHPNELLSTSTLSRQTSAPADYLAKVLQVLSGAGLIDSRRGVGGGYKLSRDLGSITLLDVIVAVNGKVSRAQTCVPSEATPHELIALQEFSERAAKAMSDIYGSCTLAEFLRRSAAASRRPRHD